MKAEPATIVVKPGTKKKPQQVESTMEECPCRLFYGIPSPVCDAVDGRKHYAGTKSGHSRLL